MGGATKTFQLVRSSEPGDLVFQSLIKGNPTSDQNVLRRHIKPIARMLEVPGPNWQVLRRSYARCLIQSGADVKSVQGRLRHAIQSWRCWCTPRSFPLRNGMLSRG